MKIFAPVSIRFFFVFFLTINLFLSSYFIDIWQTWNTTSRALSVLAVCHNGTLQIDEFHERTQDKCFVNGHYYSEKAPLPAIITIPFYYLLKSPNDLIPDKSENIGKTVYMLGGILCGSLPFMFIISVLFLNIYKTKSSVSPVLLAMLPFYGSFIFVYSGVFLNHLLGGALLLLSYIFLKDRNSFILAGIFSGLAFLSDFPLGIVLPVWATQIYFIQKSIKNSFQFIGGFLPFFIFFLGYNYLITGSFLKIPYQFVTAEEFVKAKETVGFTIIHFDALWKMLFSQYRGIFFYFPILILIAIVFLKKAKLSIRNFLCDYLFLILLVHYLLICTHEIWWGGWCYGPRHLIPIIVLLAFEGIRFISRIRFSKIFFWLLMLAGVTSTWISKSTVAFTLSDEFQQPFFQRILPLFFKNYLNENNILTLWLDISPYISVYMWLLLFIASSLLLSRWHKKVFI